MIAIHATGYWFPRGERAMATSIFDAVAKFANVISVPLVALAVVQFAWRWGFRHYQVAKLSLFPRLPDRLPAGTRG